MSDSQRMNPEVKRLWVEALESGEYPQKHNAMRTREGFDPLGVLCDLHRLHDPNGVEWTPEGDKFAYFNYLAFPHATVLQWAGLSQSAMFEVVHLDGQEQTFVQIAAYIKETL